MSDRTVSVRLIAMVGQYRAAISEAMAATEALGAAVTATNAKSMAATTGIARAHKGAATSMGSTMRSMRSMALGLGIPLAIGAAAKAFFDFEQQMAHVKAVSDDFGRSKLGFQKLSDAALESGQKFGFSAVAVGQAEEALAKAGRSTSQILGGELTSSLTLAAAGTIGLDEATKTIATTMAIFQGDGLTSAHVADRLTQSANATVSGVSEMGAAMSYVGPVAHSLGVSFDDTTTAVSLLNQAGIDGERAGTNLRGMLVQLLSPSHMAQVEMTKLGINLFDGTGKFIGLTKAAQVLHDQLGKLDPRANIDALGKLSTNASLPALIVLEKGGAQAFRDMNDMINAQSSAAKVAADKTDSTTGSFKKLGGAVNEAVVRIGEMASPALGGLADELTKVTQAFSHMGDGAQMGMLALGGFLAFGRQKMPKLTQRFGGEFTNFGLARTAQADANALAARAAAMRATSMLPAADNAMFLTRGIQAGSAAKLEGEAAAAEKTAAGFRGAGAEAGRMGANIAAAEGKMARFGAVASGVAKVAGTGLKNMGTSLLGAMGGLPGLAIMGALVGLTAWEAHTNNVARLAAESKQRIDNMVSGLTDLGVSYAMTGQVGGDATKQLLASNKDFAQLLDTTQKYGFSLDTVTKAGMGDVQAQKDLGASYQQRIADLTTLQQAMRAPAFVGDTSGVISLDAMGKAMSRLQASGTKEDFRATLRDVGGALNTTKEEKAAFDREFGDTTKVAAAMKRFHDLDLGHAAEKLGIDLTHASVATTAMVDSLMVLDSVDAKFGDRITAMTNNVGNLTTSFHSVADAQSAFFQGTQEALPAAFKGTKARTDPITGQFDVSSKQGRAQHGALSGVADAIGKSTIDTFTAVSAAGDNSAKSMQFAGLVATASFMKQRDAVVAVLEKLGMVPAAAKATANAYIAIPSEVSTNVDAKGADTTIRDLKKIGLEVVTLPRGKVEVISNTKAEADKVSHFAGTVHAIPGTKRFRIEFQNQAQADAAINNILHPPKAKPVVVPVVYHPLNGVAGGPAGAQPKPKPIVIPVSFGISGSANAVEQAAGLQNKTAKASIVPEVDAGALSTVETVLNSMSGQAPISAHIGDTSGIQAALNSFTGSASINVHLNMPAIPQSMTVQGHRWGGIHSFAGGGIQAKVGRGDLIHWAEPETGGEAFIPRKGNPDRSRSILDTAASWYGLGIHKMAAGGSTAGPAPNAPLGDFLSRYMGVADTWSTKRTAAIIDQRDALLAVKQAQADLRSVQKDAKHTALQLAQAQNALADARRNLATSNVQLAKAKLSPGGQFSNALAAGVKNTAAFIANLNALAGRGYGALAMQLLQMGGPEAEAIAANAKTWSAATASRMNAQTITAQGQQKTLASMPAMLAIRSAVKQGVPYSSLLGGGEFTGQELNTAIGLMQAELAKTPAGRAMLASMNGNTSAALNRQIRGFASGGVAAAGTMYRFAEPETGGEAVIPRLGSGGLGALRQAAAWHGMELGSRTSVAARPVQVQITVRGEGQLAAMIETRVDGALTQVARAVTRGRSSRE